MFERAAVAGVVFGVASMVWAASLSPLPEWRVSSTGLHYQSVGQGEPLVFIHGAGLDARMWDAEVERFQFGFRVVRYDARGFGRSRPLAVYSHTADLMALLDELGVGRAHLVELSLGGGIALQFALDHPSRVASLVVSAPAVPGWQRPPEAGQPFAPVYRAVREGRLDEAVDLWVEAPAARLFTAGAAARANVREMTRDNLARMLASDAPQPQAPAAPAFGRLEDVSVRTLVIVGEHEVDDLRRLTGILVDRMPDARRIELAGAGHVTNLDAPDAFADAVRRFLSGPDARPGSLLSLESTSVSTALVPLGIAGSVAAGLVAGILAYTVAVVLTPSLVVAVGVALLTTLLVTAVLSFVTQRSSGAVRPGRRGLIAGVAAVLVPLVFFGVLHAREAVRGAPALSWCPGLVALPPAHDAARGAPVAACPAERDRETPSDPFSRPPPGGDRVG